jgi:FlaA1/EpsC-like NDP-sugar epimerase
MSRVFSQYHHALHSRICFCVEFLIISGMVMLSAVIRFSVGGLTLGSGLPYVPHAFLVALVYQTCMYYAELYDFRAPPSNGRLFTKLLRSLAVATVILTVVFYMLPQFVVGRGMLLFSFVLAFCFIIGWRLLYQRLHATKHFRVNVLIIGTGEEAQKLARELLYNQPLGYEIRGFIGDSDEVGKELL